MGISVGGKRRGRTMSEINITPLTDVCLVLLIIFMCTAKFLGAGESIDVELPGASTAEPMDDVEAIQVTVSSEGIVLIDGARATPDQFVAIFAGRAAGGPTTVIISADRDTDYGLVYEVMDAARIAQLTDVALTAQPKREKPSE